LAPMLFNLALEYVIRKLPANAKHWNIKWTKWWDMQMTYVC
jgi:hypothetical protein